MKKETMTDLNRTIIVLAATAGLGIFLLLLTINKKRRWERKSSIPYHDEIIYLDIVKLLYTGIALYLTLNAWNKYRASYSYEKKEAAKDLTAAALVLIASLITLDTQDEQNIADIEVGIDNYF